MLFLETEGGTPPNYPKVSTPESFVIGSAKPSLLDRLHDPDLDKLSALSWGWNIFGGSSVKEYFPIRPSTSLSSLHSTASPRRQQNMDSSQVQLAREIRLEARNGELKSSTSGRATTMQANLIVVPSKYASDFRDLCIRNPVACPLLEATTPGVYSSRLAADSDIRTDIPGYNVYFNGTLIEEAKTDVLSEWSDDHVGFLIGCSYSFETALAANGLVPRNAIEHLAVPMFTTNIPLMPAGVFTGKAVVSMRSFKVEYLESVRTITSRYRRQHGEPIAWGWDGAERIGVAEKLRSGKVDFGNVIVVPDDEIPVFWACGVTPQVAVMESKLKGIVLSHHPGSMFVTDLRPDDESLLDPML